MYKVRSYAYLNHLQSETMCSVQHSTTETLNMFTLCKEAHREKSFSRGSWDPGSHETHEIFAKVIAKISCVQEK